MQGRYNRLLFIILAITVTALWFGCTQPDDIIAPVSDTELSLSPDRLPTLPDSLVYYFWAIDSAQNGDAYLIGSFIWSNEVYKFYDLDTNLIDSIWEIDYDLLDPFFRYLAVSVERIGDLPVGSIVPVDEVGPIMLKDTIIDPETSPVKMVFPLDLWLGNGYYCIETPTDGNSNSNDVSGLWFAEYIYDRIKYADTFNVDFRLVPTQRHIPRAIVIDTILADTSFWDCNAYINNKCVDSTNVPVEDTAFGYDYMSIFVQDADSFTIFYPEGIEGPPDTQAIASLSATVDTVAITRRQPVVDSFYTLYDTLVIDTFIHTRIDFEYVTLPVNLTGETLLTDIKVYRLNIDSTAFDEFDSTITVPPLVDFNHEMIYTRLGYVDSSFILVDKFLHSYEEVPDLYQTGCHFKGWVLSPFLQPRNAFGSLAKPVWNEFYIEQEMKPMDGGMITTGSFKSFRSADDGNPYSDNKRVPNVPGEDFLLNLPSGVDSIVFAEPNVDSTGTGTVFITLEPDNYNNEFKNFPIIYMTGSIAPYWRATLTGEHEQFSVGDPTFNMFNKFSTINNSSFGFPAINVALKRK